MNNNDQFRIFAGQGGAFSTSLTEFSRDFEADTQLNSTNPSYRSGPDLIFTRNTGGTYFNNTGTQVFANINEPRFEYSYDGGELKGLLIEEQRTNIVANSTDFNSTIPNSTWIYNNAGDGPGVTVIPNTSAITAPDGTYTASFMRCNPASGYRSITWDGAPYVPGQAELGERYCRSVYIKQDTARYIVIGCDSTTIQSNLANIFDFQTGQFILPNNLFYTFSEYIDNGWYRIGFQRGSTNEGTSRLLIGISNGPALLDTFWPDTTVPSTSSVYIWGAQVEKGSFTTSYIPTNGAQVTRAADYAYTTRSGLISYYNRNGFSLFVKGNRNHTDASENQLSAENTFISFTNSISSSIGGINDSRIYLGTNPNFIGSNALVLSGTNTYVNINTETVATSSYTLAARISANDFVLYQNQSLIGLSATGQIPRNIDRFNLGTLTNEKFLNGHILKFNYWPTYKTNSYLENLT